MRHKLRMSEKEVIAAVEANVARARDHTDDVEYSPEDATRSHPDFVIEVCQAAVASGATTVNIPDTVGYTMPREYAEIVRDVRQAVGEGPTLSVH